MTAPDPCAAQEEKYQAALAEGVSCKLRLGAGSSASPIIMVDEIPPRITPPAEIESMLHNERAAKNAKDRLDVAQLQLANCREQHKSKQVRRSSA